MKIFISMGMKDKTTEEIVKLRDEAFAEIKETLLGEAELIESVIKDKVMSKNIPMAYLAQSIALMAEADIVFFVDDFYNYGGCMIEKDIAREYGKITHDFQTENFKNKRIYSLSNSIGACACADIQRTIA